MTLQLDPTTAQFWLTVIPVVAAICTIVLFLVKGVRWTVPMIRRANNLVEDLLGEAARPGVPERPGLMQRMTEVESRTAELIPNDGSSVRDVMDRIDQRTAYVDGQLQDVNGHLHHVDQRLEVVERLTIPGRE